MISRTRSLFTDHNLLIICFGVVFPSIVFSSCAVGLTFPDKEGRAIPTKAELEALSSDPEQFRSERVRLAGRIVHRLHELVVQRARGRHDLGRAHARHRDAVVEDLRRESLGEALERRLLRAVERAAAKLPDEFRIGGATGADRVRAVRDSSDRHSRRRRRWRRRGA